METELIVAMYEFGQIHLLLSFFVFAMMFFGVVLIFQWAFGMRKSKHYRKLLSDMYVAGKIKIFAKEDGINLADEEADFNKWCKKQRLQNLDLDNSIEEELKERVGESNIKKFFKHKEKEKK